MQLAADMIEVVITGEVYELRPTLRAALRLTRKHGDFATIYNGIAADNFSIVVDVIREATGSRIAASDYLNQLDSHSIGLQQQLKPIKGKLLDYIAALAASDDDGTDDDAEPRGEPMPFADFYAELFKIGTGWLGWPPADTWEAHPAEILAAHSCRTAMINGLLKSIFGSSDEHAERPTTPVPTKLTNDGLDPSFDRAGLAALRAKYGRKAA